MGLTADITNVAQFKHYKRQWLLKDITAGLTLAAITIPVGMGYAQIANLPPVYGLYASVIPSIIYVLFASSRRVIFGTDATIAYMLGGSLLALAGTNTALLPVFAAMTAFMLGILFLLSGIFRVGAIARYLSKPTMAGFISGLAVTIVVSQLAKILQVTPASDTTIGQFFQIIGNLGQANGYAVTASIITICALIAGKKWLPHFPVTIVLLIIITAITAGLSWDTKGLEIVGAVPAGLHGLSFPTVSWQQFQYLTTISLATAFVVFADTILTARSFALRHKESFDENRELRGVGIANIVGGFFGAMPGSGSASRAAAVETAGMKTQAAQIFGALFIAIVLIFFNDLLRFMPTSVLGAIVLVAVMTLIDVKLLRTLYLERRREFWIMLITAVVVITWDVLPAVIISVFMSVFDFFMRTSKPPQAFLGVIPGKRGYYDIAKNKHAIPIPAIAIVRFGAPLIFANHEQFEESVTKVINDATITSIIIEGAAITDIDSTAADGLDTIIQKVHANGKQIYFTGFIDSTRHIFEQYQPMFPHTHIRKTVEGALAHINKQTKEHHS